jgi:cytochrome c-type biogenesis protein CcmH/NrfG
MDEYFEEDYKEGAVKWRKILGDHHKRIPRRFQVALFNKIQAALTSGQ